MIIEDDMELKRTVDGGRLRAVNLEEVNYGTIRSVLLNGMREPHR